MESLEIPCLSCVQVTMNAGGGECMGWMLKWRAPEATATSETLIHLQQHYSVLEAVLWTTLGEILTLSK